MYRLARAVARSRSDKGPSSGGGPSHAPRPAIRRGRGGWRWASDRGGTAAVEFAVCLPLIVMLVLGSIEICSMIYLKHTLRITAYETARMAVRPLSVMEQTQAHGQSLLAAQQVQSGQVVVATEVVPEGTLVLVTVTAPTGLNKIIPTSLFSPRTMQARCCMLCE